MAEDLALRERFKRLKADYDSLVGTIFGRLAILEAVFNIKIHPGTTTTAVKAGNYAAYSGLIVTADDAGEAGYFVKIATISVVNDGRNYVVDLVGTVFQRVRML